MSEAKIGKNHPLYGKVVSLFTKVLISLTIKGENHPLYGTIRSLETREKINKARGIIIYVYSLDNSIIHTFDSYRKIAEFFKVHHKTISRYIKSSKLFQNKWKLSTSLIDI